MTAPTPDMPAAPAATEMPDPDTFRRIGAALKTVALALVVIALGWALFVINAQSDSLSRHTPTLDYMACHDGRQDKALEDTFAWIDDLAKRPSPPHAKLEHDHLQWIKARAALKTATTAGSKGACPPLPAKIKPGVKPG